MFSKLNGEGRHAVPIYFVNSFRGHRSARSYVAAQYWRKFTFGLIYNTWLEYAAHYKLLFIIIILTFHKN